MNLTNMVLTALLAALAGYAVFRTWRRAKEGSACCGPIQQGVKRTGSADRNKAHYPYRAEAEITLMTCDRCAAKVENALNALDGVWAEVRIDTKKALIRSKEPVEESVIRSTVHQAGYGVGAFHAAVLQEPVQEKKQF